MSNTVSVGNVVSYLKANKDIIKKSTHPQTPKLMHNLIESVKIDLKIPRSDFNITSYINDPTAISQKTITLLNNLKKTY